MKRLILLLMMLSAFALQAQPWNDPRHVYQKPLLFDGFWNDAAAGSLTGPASPGPGTWTVWNTENTNVFRSGGYLWMYPSSTSLRYDPCLAYNGFSRTLGRVCIFKFINTIFGASGGYIGLGALNNTNRPGSAFVINGTNIFAGEASDANIALTTVQCGSFSVGTEYVFAMVLSSSGYSAITYGGSEYAYPTLLYCYTGLSDSILYPKINPYFAKLKVNFVKVPSVLLPIRPLLSQTSAGPDGTVISQSDSVSPDGYSIWPVPYSGSMFVTNNAFTWEPVAGTNVLNGWDFTINWAVTAAATITDSNTYTTTGAGGIYTNCVRVGRYYTATISGSTSFGTHTLRNVGSTSTYLTGFGGCAFRATDNGIYSRINGSATVDISVLSVQQLPLSEITRLANVGDQNQLVYASMTNVTGFPQGLVLRANSTNAMTDGIFVYYDSSSVKVDILTNSVWLNIAAVTTTYSAGARLGTRIGADGKLWVWYNEALVTGAPFDLSGYATLQTGTCAGLFLTSSQCRFTLVNFYPESDPLNRYGWKGYFDKHGNERN